MYPAACSVIGSSANRAFAVNVAVSKLSHCFGFCIRAGLTGVGLNARLGTGGIGGHYTRIIIMSASSYENCATSGTDLRICTGRLCTGSMIESCNSFSRGYRATSITDYGNATSSSTGCIYGICSSV